MELNATGKLGPFPVWAWGLVIGSLIIIRMYVSGMSTKTADNATPETTGGLSAVDEAILSGYSGKDLTDNSSGDTSAGTVDQTNAMWIAQGVKVCIEAGIAPLTAQVALQKYVDGYQLSPGDQSIINRVVEKLGLPPDGVSSIPSGTAPPAATNYETKLTITAPTKVKYSQIFVVGTKVTAVSNKKPITGTVKIYVNNHLVKTATLIGGNRLSRISIKSTEKSPSIIRVSYSSKGSWKSSSAEKSISLTK
jgi:hypothetical protein